MLLKTLKNYFKILINNKQKVKLGLLIVLPVLLYIKQDSYTLYSSESLFDYYEISNSDSFNEPMEFEDLSPNQTIYIHFNGTDLFKEKLTDKINRIPVRSKSIKLSTMNINEHFFVKIYLTESSFKFLDLHPIRRFQSNSDIVTLAKHFFNPYLNFHFSDFFKYRFENYVNIRIDNSEQSIDDLCHLLRYYSNIHSHYYGNYYYIPLKNGMISFNYTKNFMIVLMLYTLFDFSCDFNIIIVLIYAILYYIFPLTAIIKKRKEHMFIYLLIYTVLDFKTAFLYCICLYINEVKHYVIKKQ